MTYIHIKSMSILNKSVIEQIVNLPRDLSNFYEYSHYLWHDVKTLLFAELLSHIYRNETAFMLYKYEDKYIFIEIFIGTCSGCKQDSDKTYNQIIEEALEKCYITTNLDEVENYYLKKMKSMCYSNITEKAHLYYLYPNQYREEG